MQSVLMKPFNWTCPYCNHAQTATEEQFSRERDGIYNKESVLGPIGFIVESIRCANRKCRKLQLSFHLCKMRVNQYGQYGSQSDIIQSWRLLPESSAKPQPDYIPIPIVEDYVEACRIRDLSPKASATLSRRCLQGMIRDFCGITGNTLFAEIDALREAVSKGDGIRHVNQDTVEAIDYVRKIGKYGAHKKKGCQLGHQCRTP